MRPIAFLLAFAAVCAAVVVAQGCSNDVPTGEVCSLAHAKAPRPPLAGVQCAYNQEPCESCCCSRGLDGACGDCGCKARGGRPIDHTRKALGFKVEPLPAVAEKPWDEPWLCYMVNVPNAGFCWYAYEPPEFNKETNCYHFKTLGGAEVRLSAMAEFYVKAKTSNEPQ